jgi:hypothetical protein
LHEIKRSHMVQHNQLNNAIITSGRYDIVQIVAADDEIDSSFPFWLLVLDDFLSIFRTGLDSSNGENVMMEDDGVGAGTDCDEVGVATGFDSCSGSIGATGPPNTDDTGGTVVGSIHDTGGTVVGITATGVDGLGNKAANTSPKPGENAPIGTGAGMLAVVGIGSGITGTIGDLVGIRVGAVMGEAVGIRVGTGTGARVDGATVI